LFSGWDALVLDSSALRSDPHVGATFGAHRAEFFLLGRLLTVVYAVLSVPLIYQIGRDAFGIGVALLGALFSTIYPTEVFDKTVRTDSASIFFGMLALWRCLRLLDRPGATNQLLAGAAIGLAIGTKYYLATLVPVLAVVDGFILRRAALRHLDPKATGLGVGVG